MGPDLDYGEYFVSIKDYFTKLPYVDSATGMTTLNLPYEELEINDIMYEPGKVSDLSNAKIVFPSLVAFPGLRTLLQNIKEGNRVEIYNFQPDAGDPVFAGFIGPNDITEEQGRLVLSIQDTLTQLRWQHLRKWEQLNTNAAGFYTRSLQTWNDWVNEDFTLSNWRSDYNIVNQGYIETDGGGFLQISGPSGGSDYWIQSNNPAGGFTIQDGDVYLLEVDATFFTDFALGTSSSQLALVIAATASGAVAPPAIARVGSVVLFQANSGADPSFPYQRQNYSLLLDAGTENQPSTFRSAITVLTYIDNVQMDASSNPAGTSNTTALATKWGVPITYHVTSIIICGPGSAAEAAGTFPGFQTGSWFPSLRLRASDANDYIKVSNWRARKLSQSFVIPAGRFNAQTVDTLQYQPNNEENLQLLQLVTEKDGSEYRPIYRAWPQLDELEIDAVGTLGSYASRQLGYEQPGNLPSEGSPQVSPVPVVQDVGAFFPPSGAVFSSPPFRFEEGYNMTDFPTVNPKGNAHANDVIRVGAATVDSQVIAEKWSAAEVGRPQHTSAPGKVYPYFEAVTNDDRVNLQSLIGTLATYDLTRRIDPLPSLAFKAVGELPFTGKWRAGDQVYVRTQSLRTNFEQEMRMVAVKHIAGRAEREISVGRTEFDPTLLRLLKQAEQLSWLYDAAGTSPFYFVFPAANLGNIAASGTSADFTFNLDSVTPGTQITYAAIHWFADANVNLVQPVVNGFQLTPGSPTSNTDSGVFLITGSFAVTGQYKIHFINTDTVTRNLTAAFLILRVKG